MTVCGVNDSTGKEEKDEREEEGERGPSGPGKGQEQVMEKTAFQTLKPILQYSNTPPGRNHEIYGHSWAPRGDLEGGLVFEDDVRLRYVYICYLTESSQ